MSPPHDPSQDSPAAKQQRMAYDYVYCSIVERQLAEYCKLSDALKDGTKGDDSYWRNDSHRFDAGLVVVVFASMFLEGLANRFLKDCYGEEAFRNLDRKTIENKWQLIASELGSQNVDTDLSRLKH